MNPLVKPGLATVTLLGVVTVLFPLVHGMPMNQLILVVYGEFFLAQLFLARGPRGTGPYLLLAMATACLPVALRLMISLIGDQVAISFVLGGWMISHGGLRVLVFLFKLFHGRTRAAHLLLLVTGIFSITLGHFLIALAPTHGDRFMLTVSTADLLSVGFGAIQPLDRVRRRRYPRMDVNGIA